MDKEHEKVPIHLKLNLTVKEAAEYSNIGINKIDAMLRQPGFCMLGRKSWSSVKLSPRRSAKN